MKTCERTMMATAMMVVACSQPAPNDTIESEAAARGRGPRVQTSARPCRADSFFVEIPVGLDHVWPDLSFVGPARVELESYLATNASLWFCPPTAPDCLTEESVTVTITPVLPERTWPASRADGHLRFLRVTFNDGSKPLSVVADWQCDAVSMIRDTIEEKSGFAGADEFYVGRECDASVASAQAVPTNEMLSWHLSDIGLPPNPHVSAPLPIDELVDLALIDAGVGASLRTGVGVSSVTELHPGRTSNHVHGSGMAILAREVGPQFRLHDFAALNAGGQGTMADVAVALDEALFGPHSGETGRPLIVQMSLGFPPELARPAAITGAPNSCVSHENAAGEIVRYMLDVAARMDRDGDRPVFVSAASGNRPLSVPPQTFPAAPADVLHVTCGPTPVGPALYYPGQWSQEASCRNNDPNVTHVALAVGAVDERLRPTGVQIPGGETPLVAPGQHVYAAHGAAASMPQAPMCFAGPTTNYLEALPRAFTGSSVSAALVAGAAARVQRLRLIAGNTPLDRLTLARLMYLSGRDLCRTTAAGTPVRMLAVDRLDRAVRSCPAVIDCAAGLGGTEPIPGNALAVCASQLQACGLASTCMTPARPGTVLWDPGYVRERAVCAELTASNAWQSVSTCTQCPFNLHPERSVMGSLGPQPVIPVCPDCPALAENATVRLFLELTKDGPKGTKISNPHLAIKGPPWVNGELTHEVIALPDDPNADDWALGNHLDIEVPTSGSTIDFTNPELVTLGLVVDVTEPGSDTVTDYSVLDLHY